MVKRAELMQTMYSKRTLVYLAIYLEHGESERERSINRRHVYRARERPYPLHIRHLLF